MKDIVKSILIIKAWPIILIGGIIFFIVVLMSAISNAIFGSEEALSNYSGGLSVTCSQGEIDREKIDKLLSNEKGVFSIAGVFTGKADMFIEAAENHGIDPILLIAIAVHETGNGTSLAVKGKNNPGGLTNPQTGNLFVYESLEEGVDAMASNLNRLYISQGLITIEQIGHKYAPIGADNDPRNLNQFWIPTVTDLVNDLGGLSMNCDVLGTGEFVSPTTNMYINSPYGTRYRYSKGEYEFHKGIDLRCAEGDPIMAVDNGKIVVAVKSGWGYGYGHHIVVDHGDKYTLYAHLTDVNVDVHNNVKRGEPIATCGNTGDSEGAHLHFEVQYNQIYGERTDPAPFFQSNSKEGD